MKTTQKLRDGRFTIEMEVLGSGDPLLFLHGAGGLLGGDLFLEELAQDFKVIAPHLPGFGESTGGEEIDDVIDAALFYHELMDAMDIPSAHLVGYSMGGMLAAEVAALDVHRVRKLVLAASAGLWLDDYPIADIFTAQLYELPALLFHDPNSPIAQAIMALPSDPQALGAMYLERTKRFAMASKFLWPIPDRGLKKRAYRIAAPTLALWDESDKVIRPVYGVEFTRLIANCRHRVIKEAGHMLMYEQQAGFCDAVKNFLKR
jgi:pimeloyl-ACP methyl ester carboxylesterase